MSKQQIKKGSTVVILTGKDKGKTGRVIAVLPKKNKVSVERVAMVTKHVRAKRTGEASGIRREEGFIDISNVKVINE